MRSELQFTRASIRTLLPFRFCVHAIDLVVGELQGSSARPSKRPSAYYLEYLPHVQQFLFDGAGESACVHLPLPIGEPGLSPAAEVWLGDLQRGTQDGQGHHPSRRDLQLLGCKGPFVWQTPEPFDKADRRLRLRACLDSDNGIELWLNRMGVGVLSVLLHCEPLPEQPTTGKEFPNALLQLNHALATAQKAVWLRVGSDEPGFHLHQLARDLLRPMWDDAERNIDFDLRGLVFTATEVTLEGDGKDDGARLSACHDELSKLLPHLAQLHPPSHPGEVGRGHARDLFVNNEHICFIDQSGAAHAAIVRDPTGQYARQRLRRIQYEYFPGFLLAVIQRLCLQRMLNDSAAASALPVDEQEEARQELLEKVLRFGLEGEFVQVAWRSTVQKHHELAQRAFEVHEGLATVRHAMQDFNRMTMHRAAEEQRQEFELAAKKRHEDAERTERTMQVLEVFIVTFYSVELAHILGESFELGHTPWWFVFVALASFLMASSLISLPCLKSRGTKWTLISLFLMATLIHALFVGVNLWRKSQEPSSAQATERQSDDSDQDFLGVIPHQQHAE